MIGNAQRRRDMGKLLACFPDALEAQAKVADKSTRIYTLEVTRQNGCFEVYRADMAVLPMKLEREETI